MTEITNSKKAEDLLWTVTVHYNAVHKPEKLFSKKLRRLKNLKIDHLSLFQRSKMQSQIEQHNWQKNTSKEFFFFKIKL